MVQMSLVLGVIMTVNEVAREELSSVNNVTEEQPTTESPIVEHNLVTPSQAQEMAVDSVERVVEATQSAVDTGSEVKTVNCMVNSNMKAHTTAAESIRDFLLELNIEPSQALVSAIPTAESGELSVSRMYGFDEFNTPLDQNKIYNITSRNVTGG